MLFARGQATPSQLRETLGAGISQALKTLEGKGRIVLGPPPEEPEEEPVIGEPEGSPPLTDDQQSALDELLPLLAAGSGGERLVHGVTGPAARPGFISSWPAKRCARAGPSYSWHPRWPWRLPCGTGPAPGSVSIRSILTATRIRSGGRELFGKPRSHMRRAWWVGTRSALFLPVPNVGLIILDEEHDSSFKQDDRLPYQAKEVAYFRAKQDNALLLLGSATPDVKTFQAALDGSTPMVVMPNRAGAGRLPEVELVDLAPRDKAVQLKQRLDKNGVGMLAASSMAELEATLARGDQAMILLNRRGYSPLIFCLDCEKVLRCPSCEVSLTYHKGRERLVCHYCGQSFAFPRPCSSCGGCNFLPMGEGTELLEEQLSATLPPETAVARLDRDAARRAGRAEEILAEFAKGRTQVLVGNADAHQGARFSGRHPGVGGGRGHGGSTCLTIGPRSAPSRCWCRWPGGAGRGEKTGRVLIQTRNPGDPFWNLVRNADYNGFFAQEIEKRRKYGYPPFVKLGLVRASFPRDFELGQEMLLELARALRGVEGVKVLGPAPAPIAVMRDRRRFNCLLKAADWPSIRQSYHKALKAIGTSSKLRLQLDLDPVDMM